MTKKLEIGQAVQWTSQSQGSSKTKTGEIVHVVSAGELPPKEFKSLHTGAGCGMARNHESYVVKVGTKHYWPRVSKLN